MELHPAYHVKYQVAKPNSWPLWWVEIANVNNFLYSEYWVMNSFGAIDMSKVELDADQEADMKHLKEYIESIATVTEIAVAARADLSLYNNLCSMLKSRAREKSFLSYVA